MIDEIIEGSGLPFRETQWVEKKPDGTYGVWMDDVDADGSDDENLFETHNITAELYEPKPDPEAEKAFEAQLNARGRKWTKQPRYWLTDAKRYQVIYEFSYIEKI